MKIIAISDSHSQHENIIIPPCDILLHGGDFTYFSKGGDQEIINFFNWFYQQPAKHKIFIAGNHEVLFESKESFFKDLLPPGVIYLNDSMVEIEGLKIWGSPITPYFHNWAYNRQRGVNIKKHWDLIPENIDILLTHGPAYKIIDEVGHENVGCKDLLDTLNRVKPKLFCFGHIHRHQYKLYNNIHCYNCAMVDSNYTVKYKPFEINLF